MKIKILTFIANFILGKVIKDDEPRADMFLPMWLLAFSLVRSIICIYHIFGKQKDVLFQ